jgi:acetylornithine deacetylase/succinyl-diaminopimelate desuccinylase-like protein
VSTAPLRERPVELLERLLRFDTTNPPGNERECIAWIQQLLESSGCSVRTVAQDPARTTLIARLPGEGRAPPFLLQGHIDVVPARNALGKPQSRQSLDVRAARARWRRCSRPSRR